MRLTSRGSLSNRPNGPSLEPAPALPTIRYAQSHLPGSQARVLRIGLDIAAIVIGLGLAGLGLLALRRRRTREAVSGPDLESLSELATAFGDSDDTATLARELLQRVEPLVGVELSLLYLVDNERRIASAVLGRDKGRELDWFRDVTVYLDTEPSGVSTAVFEAAPFAVYDVRTSTIVSPRLAQATGARSAAFVPLLANERVIGVLVVGTTSGLRAFSSDELTLLRTVAGEAALALDRARSTAALKEALELGSHAVLAVPIVVFDELIGILALHRLEPGRWTPEERSLTEAVAREIGLAVHVAGLLRDNERRIAQQSAFFRIAEMLGQPLSLSATLDALAQAACDAFRGDAAAVLIPRGSELELAASVRLPDQLAPTVADGVSAQERTLVSPKLAGDDRFDARWRTQMYEAGLRALLAVPVASPRTDDCGLALVFFAAERTFTDEDLEVARHLADAARGALDRSELFEAERTARALSQQLARTGSVLATELDPAAVLDEVVQQAPALLGADACAVLTPEEDELVVGAAFGEGTGEVVGARVSATTWLSGDVFQSRGPVAIENALVDEHLAGADALVAAGIVAVDRDGRVVLWNAAAEQITGVPQEEAIGHTTVQVLQRDLESGDEAPAGQRLVSILRGGEEVWLSLSEAVMRDPLGAVAGRIFAFRDISSDRMVEQVKSDFVAAVSHELRTPLTSIYGFAETLLRQDIPFGEEERRTFLGYIASESGRLTEIVDQLLNVARLDAGDLQVELGRIDVGSVVSEVVETVEGDDHRFEIDLPEEPLAAEADPDKVRQVFNILVENALRYSPEGGKVTVGARRNADRVEVRVVDQGMGIPASEREWIFRKFYRAESAARDGAAGTGLGLFIAKELVNAMGGRIWVDSTAGEGSSFAFELPVARD